MKYVVLDNIQLGSNLIRIRYLEHNLLYLYNTGLYLCIYINI